MDILSSGVVIDEELIFSHFCHVVLWNILCRLRAITRRTRSTIHINWPIGQNCEAESEAGYSYPPSPQSLTSSPLDMHPSGAFSRCTLVSRSRACCLSEDELVLALVGVSMTVQGFAGIYSVDSSIGFIAYETVFLTFFGDIWQLLSVDLGCVHFQRFHYLEVFSLASQIMYSH